MIIHSFVGVFRILRTKFIIRLLAPSGYHAIRRMLRNLNSFLEYNQNQLTAEQLRLAWSVFADSFLVEARELSVSCRQFSLPSCLAFLDLDVDRRADYVVLSHLQRDSLVDRTQ